MTPSAFVPTTHASHHFISGESDQTYSIERQHFNTATESSGSPTSDSSAGGTTQPPAVGAPLAPSRDTPDLSSSSGQENEESIETPGSIPAQEEEQETQGLV